MMSSKNPSTTSRITQPTESQTLQSTTGPAVAIMAAAIFLGLSLPALAQPDLQVAQGLTVINSGDTVDVGDVRVGEPASAVFTLRNNGDLPLSFSQPPVLFAGDLVGTAGLVGGTSAPESLSDVAPGGFAVLAISFQVLSAGQVSLEAILGSNDPDGFLHQIVLQANGIEPEMAVSVNGTAVQSRDVVDFGNADLGTEFLVDILIENTGDATLNVEEVLLDLSDDGGAGLDNTVPLTIEAGQSATIPMTLTVVQQGEQITQVNLTNDGAVSPFVLVFRANGVPPPPPPAPGVACGGIPAPFLPMALLGLVALKLSFTRTRRRN